MLIHTMIQKHSIRQPAFWFIFLAIAHLWFVGIHYARLWSVEHYQFFPFAVAAFAWLLHTRKSREERPLSVLPKLLIAVDVLLLVAATAFNSPWLGCVAAFLLCFAYCLSQRDADSEGNASLGYLALLPLMTLRLPLAMDLDVMHWLQAATTRVASGLLNYFEYLHLRKGNVLEFPGKQFLVEEACSGVQSLFTVVFLAGLVICIGRRKTVHSALLLGSAFGAAAVMNVVRVAAISMAWHGSELDLSTGWQHDATGYAALIIAAMLVICTDVFLSLLFAGVANEAAAAGAASAYHNPFTRAWNTLFQNPQGKRFGKTPRFSDFFRPRLLVGWFVNFVTSWFISRNRRLLPASILFLVFGIGGGGFLWWLETSPQQELSANYERALDFAIKKGDTEAQRVYLESLTQLQPHEHRYRFQLAVYLFNQDQHVQAAQELEFLTTVGLNGYAPARLWLVEQAQSESPAIPLTEDQIQGHLLMALKAQPNNSRARRLLAELQIRKGKFQAAENNLSLLTDDSPELLLPLAKIQRRLSRSDNLIESRLTKAREYLQARLLAEPENWQCRIELAESLVLLRQFADAERILSEGLSESSSPQLRVALGKFYAGQSATQLKQSLLNRDSCATLLIKAIRLVPDDRGILAQALTLSSFGAKFTAIDLQPAVDSLRSSVDPPIEERVMLVQALAMSQQMEPAIAELRPLTVDKPELKIVLARLLRSSGREQDAQKLIDELLARNIIAEGAASWNEKLEYVDILNLDFKIEPARNLLISMKHLKSEMSEGQQQQWNLLFGQTSLALYDHRMAADSFESSQQALTLLSNALQTPAVYLIALKRLAALSCSEHKFAGAAESVLNRLLAEGHAKADIYNLVGSQAMRANQVEKARRYLERARRLENRNPMILNNLALALVREKSKSPERALKLVESALEILPAHPAVLSTRAEVYIALERWEDARHDLEVSSGFAPNDVISHRMLAQVYDAMGETSMAIEHRRRLQELKAAQLSSQR